MKFGFRMMYNQSCRENLFRHCGIEHLMCINIMKRNTAALLDVSNVLVWK